MRLRGGIVGKLRQQIKYGRPAYAISEWNRRRKWDAFQREIPFDSDTRVLDIGYSDREYSPTDNFLEKYYPFRSRITALGIEEPTEFSQRYPEVEVVQYEGRVFPFGDDSFDVVWSNAVVEHVGSRAHQVLFLREAVRTGKRVWITTPNRFFPVEIHTRRLLLHWLPKRWYDEYLRRAGDGWAAGSYMRLLSSRDIRRMLGEIGVSRYRLVRNRVGPFTLDFVLIIDP